MTSLETIQLHGTAPRPHKCDSEEDSGVLLSLGLQVNHGQMDEFINNINSMEQSPS